MQFKEIVRPRGVTYRMLLFIQGLENVSTENRNTYIVLVVFRQK